MTSETRTKSDVSVVIPTWRRPDALAVTLRHIKACRPLPCEILVHIDANDDVTEHEIRKAHPDVIILKSDRHVGPGGGRNRLIRAATCPLIASFDDDSYPLDKDYFQRLERLFEAYPDAGILSGSVIHRDEHIKDAHPSAGWTGTFIGCACAYRRDVFLSLYGYLELPIAYGAEEADVAIQLLETRYRVLYSDWLRVYHDTLILHHQSTRVNAGSISNVALLAFVRYPSSWWWYATIQVMNRVYYSLRVGRFAGIVSGLFSIPRVLWNHRSLRKPVSEPVIHRYLQMRETIEWQEWPASLMEQAPVVSNVD